MSGKGSTFYYVFSLLLGFTLEFVAVPDALAPLRPMWLPLLLAGWTLHAPRLPHLPIAFLLGLGLDVMLDCALGQHAIGLLVVSYAVARMRPFLVLYPLWQTTLVLAPLWAGYALLMGVIDELTHHVATPSLRWWPLLPTVMLWPVLDLWLLSLDRRRPHDDD